MNDFETTIIYIILSWCTIGLIWCIGNLITLHFTMKCDKKRFMDRISFMSFSNGMFEGSR